MSSGRLWIKLPNFIVICRFVATKAVASDESSPISSDTNASESWLQRNSETSSSSPLSNISVSANIDSRFASSVEDNVDPMQHFAWISGVAPRFSINGKQIKVLKEPSEFYQTLKNLARTATRRIVLASLYLGTGQLEHDLVDCIHESCGRSKVAGHDPLRVSVLLDFNRGSRGEKNSRTMLLPLLKDFGASSTVALYHTPTLRGIPREVLPERYNETFGVNHMKVYVFDDTVVISGANLSDSYFTNRQDRYVVLANCPQIADFFDRLISCVQRYSFHLQPDDTVRLPDGIACHPFADSDGGNKYCSEVGTRVRELVSPKSTAATTDIADASADTDTVIYPLIQMGPFNVTVDEQVTNALFRHAPADVTVYLASGYFNLTDHYMRSIIRHCTATFRILTASPEANGFYGSKGWSGAIPDAYTFIAKKFYKEVVRCRQQKRITLHEYSRPGWTVHTKGLWYYLPGHTLPTMSMVGSPNFGHRSVYRDLEAQIVIVTKNELLQRQLHEEKMRLYSPSSPVSRATFARPDRLIPRWVKFVTPLIRNFF